MPWDYRKIIGRDIFGLVVCWCSMSDKIPFDKQELSVLGVRVSLIKDSSEIGHAFLYVLKNDLHKEPFGFLEDVFINEKYRSQGCGKELVKEVISEAKKRGCYKLLCTSRSGKDKVHKFYTDLGFKDCGKEFRMDLGLSI